MPTDDRTCGPLPDTEAEASLDRLRGAGWSIAEYTVRFVSPPALVRLVVGESGAARLLASGSTRAEAAGRACAQAEAIGMLAPGGDAA
jgi:hypothetical protein